VEIFSLALWNPGTPAPLPLEPWHSGTPAPLNPGTPVLRYFFLPNPYQYTRLFMRDLPCDLEIYLNYKFV